MLANSEEISDDEVFGVSQVDKPATATTSGGIANIQSVLEDSAFIFAVTASTFFNSCTRVQW